MKSVTGGIIMLLLSAGISMAQPGRNALGLRVADGVGITLKTFLDRSFAIETQLNAGGILYWHGHSITASGLIEYHLPLPSPEFRIFFGGGMHVGRWGGREGSGHPNEAVFGLDGIGGVEYIFPRIPIGISVDLKPSINYVQEVEVFPHNTFGLAARYYFGSNRVKPAVIPKLRKSKRR